MRLDQLFSCDRLSGFQNGTYLSWTVFGSVLFRVTNLIPGSNAVVSGLFLG